jgi:VWFA-related protein
MKGEDGRGLRGRENVASAPVREEPNVLNEFMIFSERPPVNPSLTGIAGNIGRRKMAIKIGAKLKPFLALSLACLQAGFVHAAQSPQAEPPIRNLSLVALDSRGQPVNDLTADDFVISDAGKSRKVAFVRHIERRLAPAQTLEPGEVSNRSGRVIPHATVILLDLMNQSFSTRGIAANQLIHYLQSAEDTDFLYIYLLTLDGRLFTVRGLPGPEAAAAPSTTEDGSPWTRQIKPIMDEALRTVLRVRPIEMDVAIRVQLTYAALETLGSAMAAVPGRKNVVWITDGVPITLGPIRSDTGDIVDFTPLLRHLSQALDRSEIAIYPVPQVFIGSSNGPPDATGERRSGAGTEVLSYETLNQFANMTGGRANGGKDIGAAIRQAMNDARTSYLVGYYAPDDGKDSDDGKYHKLRVTTTRKGVRIQAKTGYYAWPSDPQGEAMQAVRNAISQPVDAAEIGIRASFSSKRLRIAIDANDIAFLHEADRYSGHLSLLVAAYEPSGLYHPSALRPVDLSYNAEERAKAMAQGIQYQLDLPQTENISTIRLIAFDNVSHSIGSVTAQLKPPHQ